MPITPDWDLIPGDIEHNLELAPLAIVRSALPVATLALMDAHANLVFDDPDSSSERAAVRIVNLADRLRAAIDDYRRALARDGRDKNGLQIE
jgi:hypothetical protein